MVLSRSRKGFTLIELLVVIAIIAILAAILFPVFAKAREKARQSSCASNLKQLGLGFMQYSQDYDELMPPYGIGGVGAANGPWFHLMTPYLKSTQILKCPSDSSTAGSADGWWYPAGVNAYHCSYGFNTNLNVRALASIESTATTVMLADGNAVPDPAQDPEKWVPKPNVAPWLIDDMTNTLVPALSGSSYNHYAGPSSRHSGVCNVAWADGHVKAMKVDRFYVYKTNADSPCLNPATGCP